MAYTTAEGRTRILADMASAVSLLAAAVTALGEAYERLDDQAAERMEARLFRPLQGAYGQLGRGQREFAARTGLALPDTSAPSVRMPESARASLEHAAGAIEEADAILAELQDSLLPVEVGDQQLREALSGTRSVIAPLPEVCDGVIRTLGR